MDIEQMREYALAECDHVEVLDKVADSVAASLREGRTVEAAFAPGNGTRYCWLFVPIGGEPYDTVDVNHGIIESSSVSEGGVWVANLIGDVRVYPVALMRRFKDDPHPSYVAEKWYGGVVGTDVMLLCELFSKIAERCRA